MDIIEAALLAGREGEVFDAVVVDVENDEERRRRAAKAADPDRAAAGVPAAGGAVRGQVVIAERRCERASRGRAPARRPGARATA
ncbi:hypothetical protein NKG05_08690 [Oerskovia sp. M15]